MAEQFDGAPDVAAGGARPSIASDVIENGPEESGSSAAPPDAAGAFATGFFGFGQRGMDWLRGTPLETSVAADVSTAGVNAVPDVAEETGGSSSGTDVEEGEQEGGFLRLASLYDATATATADVVELLGEPLPPLPTSRESIRSFGPCPAARIQVGKAIRSFSFEMFIIILIVVEIALIFAEIAIDENWICINPQEVPNRGILCDDKHSDTSRKVHHILHMVAQIISVLFLIEIALKVFVDQGAFFKNPFRLLDFVVVVLQFILIVCLPATSQGSVFAIAGTSVRLWRLCRLFNLAAQSRDEIKHVEKERTRIAARKLIESYGIACPPELAEDATLHSPR